MLYNIKEIERIQKAINEGKTVDEELHGSDLDFANSNATLYECLEKSRRSFSLFNTIVALFKKEMPAYEMACTDCIVNFMEDKLVASN